MTEQRGQDQWNVAEWHGKTLVDRHPALLLDGVRSAAAHPLPEPPAHRHGHGAARPAHTGYTGQSGR
jgi:hypothetical protein